MNGRLGNYIKMINSHFGKHSSSNVYVCIYVNMYACIINKRVSLRFIFFACV